MWLRKSGTRNGDTSYVIVDPLETGGRRDPVRVASDLYPELVDVLRGLRAWTPTCGVPFPRADLLVKATGESLDRGLHVELVEGPQSLLEPMPARGSDADLPAVGVQDTEDSASTNGSELSGEAVDSAQKSQNDGGASGSPCSDHCGTVSVAERVSVALRETDFDWRTPGSLAREIGADEADVRVALSSMRDELRHPVAARGEERDYFRLAARGLTWQERIRRVKLALARTPVGPDRVAV